MSEDLISREKAYEVLSEYYHHRTDMQHQALKEALDRVPSAELQPTCNKLATSCNQLATDCISRQDAIALMCKALHYNYEEGYAVTQMLALPSADIDLSDYSDRLWRNAYERGKMDAEPRWIPVEDEPPKEKKHYWVCTDTGYQCECRWTNNVYGLRDSDEWGWSIFDIPQYSKVVAYMSLPEPWKGEEDG